MRETVRITAAGEVTRRTNGRPNSVDTAYEVPETRTLRLTRILCGTEYSIHEARVEILLVDGDVESVIAVGYFGTIQMTTDIEVEAGQNVVIRRVNGDPTDLHMTGIVEGILL